jgi:hypothetical protein
LTIHAITRSEAKSYDRIFGKFRPNAPAIKPIVSDQAQDDQG